MSDKKILYPHTKPVFVERFNLIVRDLDLVSSYYQHAIMFWVLAESRC